MAMQNHVRNPLEWGWEHLKQTGQAVGSAAHTMDGAWEDRAASPPVVRRIGAADIGDALAKGVRDFGACRTDVVFLCLLYPVAGLVISRMAFDYGMLALVFPMIAGFALVAPLFGVGLYEISRRREQGLKTSWTDAFAVARDALNTPAGWTMTVVGVAVGFLFALVVLVTGVVSFPLLLDRNVGVGTAVATSVRAVAANPAPMAMWGLIVAGLLVLGHATWHLYRKVVD